MQTGHTLDEDYDDNTTGGGEQLPTSTRKKNTTPRLEDHFFYGPRDEVKKMSAPFKIHFAIALFACTLCFFIWRWTSTDNIATAAWWWIYPVFFFMATLTVHKNLGGDYVQMAIHLVVIINVGLFFTNYLIEYRADYPWFIYPLFVSAMICLAIYYRQAPEKHTWLKLFTHEYILLNIVLFVTWIMTRGFPWFIFPLLVLGLPLAIVYVVQVYKEKRKWVFVGIVSIDIGIMVFLIWGFTEAIFPWFLFAWVPLALLCAATWFIWKGEDTYQDVDEEQPKFIDNQPEEYQTDEEYYAQAQTETLYPTLDDE